MNRGMKRAGARLKAVTVLVMLSLAAASAAYGGVSGHAKPPKGFSWKRFDGIQALLLVPRGWHVKERKGKGEVSVLIAKDKIGNNDDFTTGFSLNAVRDVPSRYKMPPTEYAFLLMEKKRQEGESKGLGTSSEDRHIKGYRGFFRSGSEQTGRTVQYAIALGNDTTGTLYMITFESPEAEWDEAWKTGVVIMNNLGLDEKF